MNPTTTSQNFALVPPKPMSIVTWRGDLHHRWLVPSYKIAIHKYQKD